MDPAVRINGLSSKDYLKLMSPIKYATDKEGCLVKDAGAVKRIHQIKYIFHTIGHFFYRSALKLTCRGWFNDKKLAHRLREGLPSTDLKVQAVVIRVLYNELTHRLKDNEDLKAIKRALDGLEEIPSVVNNQPTNIPPPPSPGNKTPKLTKPVDRTPEQPTLQPTVKTFPVVGELKNKLDERTGVQKKVIAPFVPPTIADQENNIAAYKKLAEQIVRPTATDLEKVQILKKYEKLNKLLQDQKTQLDNCTDEPDSVVKSIKEELFLNKNYLKTSDNVPTLYRKEELMERVRFLFVVVQENRLKSDLNDFLKKLKKIPYDYIYGHSIEYFTERIENLTRGLTQYYSTYDYNPSGSGQTLSLMLQKDELEKYQTRSGLVIKRAVENGREILAGKLLEILGLNKFFVTKQEVALPSQMVDAKMQDEKTGIVGRWVVGEKFFKNEWDALMMAQRDFSAASFRDKENIPENVKTALKEAEERVRQFGCHSSVQELALADMLLWSSDSHTNQYKLSKGELYNYDFARFFPPSPVVKGGDEVYTTFKSALLDHPSARDPMEENLIQKIKSLDLNIVRDNFQKYVGDPESYEKAVKDLESITTDKQIYENKNRLALSDKQLALKHKQDQIDICTRYGIPIKGSLDEVLEFLNKKKCEIEKKCRETKSEKKKAKGRKILKELELDKSKAMNQISEISSLYSKYSICPKLPSVAELGKVLSAKESEIRKACYSKIHPKAFEPFIYRLEKLKEYVNKVEKPTLVGAFEAIYPDLNLFIQLYQRYKNNPFLFIGSYLGNNMPFVFSYIINHLKEESLATAEEIERLEKAQKRLCEQACEWEEISTTYNI